MPNLITTQYEEIIKALGGSVEELPDRLECTYLKCIKECVEERLDGTDGEGGGASVQADWAVNDASDPAYVKNRTHWLERPYEPIVWDGSTEGRSCLDVSALIGEAAGTLLLYKVTDEMLTGEQIAAATLSATIDMETLSGGCSQNVDISEVIPQLPQGTARIAQFDLTHSSENGEEDFAGLQVVIIYDTELLASIGLASPGNGTYAQQRNVLGGGTCLMKLSSDTYHTIDDRFLPELRAGGNVKFDYPIWQTSPMHTTALAFNSNSNKALGDCSHAEGYYTTALSFSQHVQGLYNVEDSSGKYAHIVGNGRDNRRSNAHTLDWDGNAWYQGTVESEGIILTSPNGTKYKVTVTDDGTLSVAAE